MPKIFQIYLTSRLAVQVSLGLPSGILRYVLLQYTIGTVYNIPQCGILLSTEQHIEALEGVVTEAKNTGKARSSQ
jgi:hypothetical protein